MNELLRPGQVLYTRLSNLPCQIEQFLGGGGQGEVYRATLLGQQVAIKWYSPYYLKQDLYLTDRLNRSIKAGAPSSQFLWPMELVTTQNGQGLGYVMPLRDLRYRGFAELLSGEINPSFKALATAGFELADSFSRLHARGMSYCDISHGNIFLEPETGHILICDNDNVEVDKSNQSAVLGTGDYMAPEIVRRQSRPCRETDLFSLSVVLFYMFMVHHPFNGKLQAQVEKLGVTDKEANEAVLKLRGTNPIFIFDPGNESNRPVPGHHQNVIDDWKIYPQFIRDLFVKAFTEGIQNPGRRVQETEWRLAMIRLRDLIVHCPHCQVENFYDPYQSADNQFRYCLNADCQREIQNPPQIRIGENRIVLNYGTELFPYHVGSQKPYDFSTPVAAVVQHPSNAAILGLKNLLYESWIVTTVDGETKDVSSGRSVTLRSGTRINFGKVEGIIQ